MPITDEIKKTLSDPTPLYALAGAGDLAYEKLREVPSLVESIAADRKGAQEKATARLHVAQSRLIDAQAKVTETVTALPTDIKVLQEKAQTFALQQVGRAAEFAVKAKEVYDELAERGKVVVVKGRQETSAEIAEIAQSVAPEESADQAASEDSTEASASGSDGAADDGSGSARKTARPRKTSTAKSTSSDS